MSLLPHCGQAAGDCVNSRTLVCPVNVKFQQQTSLPIAIFRHILSRNLGVVYWISGHTLGSAYGPQICPHWEVC